VTVQLEANGGAAGDHQAGSLFALGRSKISATVWLRRVIVGAICIGRFAGCCDVDGDAFAACAESMSPSFQGLVLSDHRAASYQKNGVWNQSTSLVAVG